MSPFDGPILLSVSPVGEASHNRVAGRAGISHLRSKMVPGRPVGRGLGPPRRRTTNGAAVNWPADHAVLWRSRRVPVESDRADHLARLSSSALSRAVARAA